MTSERDRAAVREVGEAIKDLRTAVWAVALALFLIFGAMPWGCS